MTKRALNIFFIFLFMLLVLNCNNSNKPDVAQEEDHKAKDLLDGIWLDADENNIAFRIKGDTVYYPDSTSQAVKFQIISDTMILLGNSISKYPIIKQSPHVFEFKNQNGDIVRLVKSEDPNDSLQFVRSFPVTLNQKTTIKRDTIVSFSDKKYHCYVQINPTTYKVYRTSYNEEGLEVENVYYDNIIHVSIFSGSTKIFSKDFSKDDFKGAVPRNMLQQSVLSDIKLMDMNNFGFHYHIQLAIPDSPSSFIVKLTVSYKGKINMGVSD